MRTLLGQAKRKKGRRGRRHPENVNPGRKWRGVKPPNYVFQAHPGGGGTPVQALGSVPEPGQRVPSFHGRFLFTLRGWKRM